MLRCSGGSVRAFEDTSRSPTWISPSDGSRKPAISRSVVVLPQPEGPNRQTSWPWSIRSETLSTTASDPNRLVKPRKSTDANQLPPLLFYAHSNRKTGIHFCGMRARAVVGLIYHQINISTNKGAPKRLGLRLRTYTFAEPFDRGLKPALAVRYFERVEADFDDAERAQDHRGVDV